MLLLPVVEQAIYMIMAIILSFHNFECSMKKVNQSFKLFWVFARFGSHRLWNLRYDYQDIYASIFSSCSVSRCSVAACHKLKMTMEVRTYDPNVYFR